ncbi:MAG: hypothetical protein JWQ35_290 [Bacteriovoracaceae bacterium]|nr:hypothetical protein [Bacteriovoracaceae bacterium]
MKSNHLLAAAIILSSLLTGKPLFAVEPDLSTPKNAVLSFYKTKDSGDTNALKQVVTFVDPKAFDLVSENSTAVYQMQRLHGLIEKKFGKEEADRIIHMGKRDLKPVEAGKESINGNVATFTKQGEDEPAFYLNKIDGKWKIDLSKMKEVQVPASDLEFAIARMSIMARGFRSTADDLEKGVISSTGKEIKTPDDLLDDLNMNIQKSIPETDDKKSGEEKKP